MANAAYRDLACKEDECDYLYRCISQSSVIFDLWKSGALIHNTITKMNYEQVSEYLAYCCLCPTDQLINNYLRTVFKRCEFKCLSFEVVLRAKLILCRSTAIVCSKVLPFSLLDFEQVTDFPEQHNYCCPLTPSCLTSQSSKPYYYYYTAYNLKFCHFQTCIMLSITQLYRGIALTVIGLTEIITVNNINSL
ncbi:hypothetical protein AGLY_013498 [Aphis glycines]|uniref:Uncharacterized protein n=1 Tax=Aphis glycines TaxID=307491 RepID=A0A6G0T6U8_APHGL|nr:hypothetical protein AGLY_013498 [Aphis glycines]